LPLECGFLAWLRPVYLCKIASMEHCDRFGPVLKGVRVERGLTQEQLADAAGLHRTEISLLERGLRKPLLETIVAICRGLGITPAELLGEVR
jgi:transcriptional regulator with XRE-family HTH domain